jgi:hypothetical protein
MNVFKFKNLSGQSNVLHFISTRHGGISAGNCKGLNIGFGTNDSAENVLQNRKILATNVGVPLNHFVFPRQTHSANIALIHRSQRGLGVFERETALPETDALITNEPETCIAVQVADCVPLLLFDPENRAVGAIHAGWRGTASQICMHTIRAMQWHFGTRPENLLAGIGPSIGACCYNTGYDVKEAFDYVKPALNTIFEERNSKLYLNLWAANREQLVFAGVKPENIEVAGVCSHCNAAEYFSHRHSNGDTGRFAAAIMLT